MIFVIGGTGTVGSGLLARLANAGGEVRALAHSERSREAIAALGAEAVDGDLADATALEAALQGADHLFLLSPPDPDQAAREKAAIDAAARAGVAHVVALSVSGADAASSSSFARWHGEIDDHLVASGLGYTILRPSGFMQVHLLPVPMVKSQGTWFGMTGDGTMAFIDADDIAAVAAVALTQPGHAGAVYELTGPEALSMPQAAAQLSAVLGREVPYVDVPAEQYRASLVGVGLPDWLADALVALYQQTRAGHTATVTNFVEQVTGRPARSYREVAGANKAAFD
jgi:uncharacterized protein YbjT (DUF2867 family)